MGFELAIWPMWWDLAIFAQFTHTTNFLLDHLKNAIIASDSVISQCGIFDIISLAERWITLTCWGGGMLLWRMILNTNWGQYREFYFTAKSCYIPTQITNRKLGLCVEVEEICFYNKIKQRKRRDITLVDFDWLIKFKLRSMSFGNVLISCDIFRGCLSGVLPEYRVNICIIYIIKKPLHRIYT